MRLVSVVHSSITTYNSYQCLVDEHLRENILQNVSDNHFWCVSILSGYFVYDTIISFTNLAAEDEAAGAIQTMVHHFFVLGTLPVGLYTNTWGWIGSGVLSFYTEVTGPSLNLIWILRTVGLVDHWIYAVNGIFFGITFIFLRVFVLGYYCYVNVALVYAHWHNSGQVTTEFWSPGTQVTEGIDCSHFVPRMELYGSCQFGMWMMLGIWGVSLVWVPAVVAKLIRGIKGFMVANGYWEKGQKNKKT